MTFLTTSFGKVSTDNSSTLSLASTGSFTGIYEEVKEFSEVTVIMTLASSESVTLIFESSIDASGTNKSVESVVVNSPSGTHTMVISSEYFRIIVNADKGTAATGAVQTIYHKAKSKSITAKVGTTLTDTNDAEIVKAVMVAQDPSTGDYTNITLNGNGNGISVALNTATDAFGRIQISTPISLLTSKQLVSNDSEQIATLTSGTGTTSYTTPFPHTNMQVSANSDRVVRQSKQYSSYQPGKSLNFLLTGTLLDDPTVTNVRARIGPFDDLTDKSLDTNPTGDGFFFEVVSGGTPTINLVYRTSNDGAIPPTLPPTQTDTTVAQSSWNIDPLDGSGNSGYTLDVSKRQIYAFLMEWLGTGDVICGVYHQNKFIPCHRFIFSNGTFGSDTSIAYSTRGSLPCRYELEATGIPSATATMRQICIAVSSDAGFTPEGKIYSIGGTVATTIGTTEAPILSLRLNQSAGVDVTPRVILNILKTTYIVTGSGDTIYSIYLFENPTQFGAGPLTGASFVNANTDPSINGSVAEYDISASAVDLSGVTYTFRRIERGYFSNNTSSIDSNLDERFLTILSDIAGNSDMVVVTMKTFSGNQNIAASIQWQEYD